MSAMQRASLVETYEPFLGRSAVEEFIEAWNVERYFEERWRQATVATLSYEIVGIAVLEGALLDPHLGETKHAFERHRIDADGQRRRTGSARGNEVTLEVWTVNGRAVEFYERRGFSVLGTLDDPATGLEKLAMRKAL